MWNIVISLSALGVADIAGAQTAAGFSLELNTQTAAGISGFLILALFLAVGNGYQAIKLNPGFRFLLALGALLASAASILAMTAIVEKAYLPYGAGALAVFLLGLIPPYRGKEGVQPLPAVLGAIIFAAALALLVSAITAGAERAVTSVAVGMAWYGAFLALNERRSEGGPDVRPRMAYAGLMLLAIGVLILAHLMYLDVAEAQLQLDSPQLQLEKGQLGGPRR